MRVELESVAARRVVSAFPFRRQRACPGHARPDGKLTLSKFSGFPTYRATEVARYHVRDALPESKPAHGCC